MNALREFLRKNGIKHKKFAEILGTSPFTLHGILNNIRYPSLPMALDIEEKTMGAVTVYDYHPKIIEKNIKNISKKKTQKIKRNNLNSL